jgi:hypothetical protein
MQPDARSAAPGRLGASRRPKSLSLHGRHWHFFLFKWGATLRWRRPDNDWIHLSMNTRSGQWQHDPSRRSRLWQIETWRTADGTRERVSGSKRYVRVKVAL